MEPDKDTSAPVEPDATKPADDYQAPADALSRTPDDLEQEEAKQTETTNTANEPGVKKPSAIKRIFRRLNVYFLLFLLVVIVAGAISVVSFLNSQKTPEAPTMGTQGLSEDALKQLANTDASIGDTSQTLTIQGNAVIAGQTLTRGNLNVAGNFQSGGSIRGPSLTISGASSLGSTQTSSLQVEGDLAVQGNTTLRGLSVAGSSSFNGPMRASQITASRLILSGNAELQVPNHISFTGPTPSRSINSSTLGGGGSVSIKGSDTAGTIRIGTGNSPSAGCFARITFRQAFSKTPYVIVSPVGSAAGKTNYYVDRNTTGFSICTANAAPANQTFSFDYFVMN
jgi:cytoskeletal protein CcmA (bactofilin family)